MNLSHEDIIALESDVAKAELAEFGVLGWSHVENRPLVRNWHMDAVSEHLQAVSAGQIRRIIFNIPPRHTKSLLCNVFWPSWDWIENPWRCFLFSSYRTSLSERDNKKANRLLQSEWYQRRFEPRIDPLNDTNSRWGIKGGGERLVTSVAGASSTGEGGDVIVIDDPISADGARSSTQLKSVIDWWDETIKGRLNDPKTGAFVVIMQRLHESDLTGHILANETGWDHLCLPARYEVKHCYPVQSSIGFKDPRTCEGEILNPKRFDDDALNSIARPGTYADAGQLQQRPAPRKGGIFDVDQIEIIPEMPANVRWVRGWDLAATEEKDAAYTAGAKLGVTPTGEYIIGDMKRGQLSAAKVEALIRKTAVNDGRAVKGSIPQDPGQAGKAQVASLLKLVAGYTYTSSPESGDKVSRAEPFAAQVEVGNVKMVRGDWNKELLDEMRLFPGSKFKDQVDAISRAFSELITAKQSAMSTTYD